MSKSKARKNQSEGGLSWIANGVERITLNLRAGVIGRLTILGISSLVFPTLVLWLLPESIRTPSLAVKIVSIGLTIVLVVVIGILWYANRHPETALMEGAQILTRKKLDVATKIGTVSAEQQVPSTDPARPAVSQVDTATLLPDTAAPNKREGG